MSRRIIPVCIVLALLLVLGIGSARAATCLSTGSGNWGATGSWGCGSVPTCGDSVVIQAGHSMTISSQQDLRGCGSLFVLVVRGTLRFVTGNKLRLACGSRVYVFGGGSIVPGGGGGNSNELEICGETMWQAADGTYTGPGCFPSTLAACSRVLPVELLLFEEAECREGGVCLRWATASEHNNNYFELERSADGLGYESLQRIKSRAPRGNSVVQLSYEASDLNPANSLSYYRLKQVDFDGTYAYAPVIAVNRASAGDYSFDVFPNPNGGRFSYRVWGEGNAGFLSFELREVSGRLVYEKLIYPSQAQGGEIELEPGIAPGFYICYLHVGGKVLKTKMIIQARR